MECSLPGSSVHRICQVRMIKWAAIPSSRGIFLTQGSNLGLLYGRQILYHLIHQASPIKLRICQSILKEVSPECSLEGLMLKLKLQYFGHLSQRRADSIEKTPMLGKIEGRRKGWDGWMASPTQWTWVWVNSGSWWWSGRPGVLQSMGHKELDMTEWLNWTELMLILKLPLEYL